MNGSDIKIGGEYGLRNYRRPGEPFHRATVIARDGNTFEVRYAEAGLADPLIVRAQRIVCPWSQAADRMKEEAERLAKDPYADDLSSAEAAKMLGVNTYRLGRLLMEDSAFRRSVTRPNRGRYVVTRTRLEAWIDDPDRKRKEVEDRQRSEQDRRKATQAASLKQDPGNWQEKDLLTVEEVAAILRLSPSAVNAALGREEIPGGFRIGTRWRVARQRFEMFLNSEPEPVNFTVKESLALLGRALTVTQTAHLDFERAVT